MGYGQIAYSPLQAGPYLNPGIEKYDYNPTKAKEQLEQAGWETGADGIYEKNGIRLAFAINCGEGDQVRIDMAKICAQQLREIGADVTVAVNAQTDWANQEAYLIGWGSVRSRTTTPTKYSALKKVPTSAPIPTAKLTAADRGA